MQKKARQDNKGGKDPENDEKKLNIKEEEQSELMCSNSACLINLSSTYCFIIDAWINFKIQNNCP